MSEPDDLSLAAVRHAAGFAAEGPGRLAGRLYRFNRIPLTPRLRQSFPDALAVEEFLVGGPRGRSRALRGWERIPVTEGYECWMILRRGPARGRASHKLYVGVDAGSIRDALHAAVRGAEAAGVGRLKVGVTAEALVRPDKLIVYADDREQLEAVAAELAPRLAGAPEHLVPFTASTRASGPLSWGMDPPERLRGLGSSWRTLVCRQLGAALTAAEGNADERSTTALDSLAAIGIEPGEWRLRTTWADLARAAA